MSSYVRNLLNLKFYSRAINIHVVRTVHIHLATKINTLKQIFAEIFDDHFFAKE